MYILKKSTYNIMCAVHYWLSAFILLTRPHSGISVFDYLSIFKYYILLNVFYFFTFVVVARL